MNAVPIFQYGAMPVQRQAAYAIGYRDSDSPSFRSPKHVVVDDAPLLGDRFAIPAVDAVASIGDFVEMGAVALLVSIIPKRPRKSARTTVRVGHQVPQ
jgi:hypothetical protein